MDDLILDGTNTIAPPDNIGGVKIVSCTSTIHTVSEPAKPMKQNNKFSGEYTDTGLNDTYDFGTAVTGDFALYAKWETPEAISYVNKNGETVSNFTNYTPLEGYWAFDMSATRARHLRRKRVSALRKITPKRIC